jgi:thiol-disulfide isomerase/thioredoxin
VKRLAGVSSAIVLLAAVMANAQQPPIITNVRAAIAKQDFGEAERLVAAHRAANGVTPPMLEALSWISRGALAAKQGPKAEALAQQAYDLGVAALKGRTLDAEPHLPVAIGAAIEVLAKAAAERGARADAVSFLQRELATFANTSIHTRIQKNLNLLSLEGTPAPELDLSEHIGKPPPTLASLKGKVTLLFFWAHWCSDCKAQGPVVASLMAKYASQGLVVVAPTQRYGYVAGGKTAGAADETRYIAEVQRTSYPGLAQVAVPVSDRNHKRYGVSTTPTLVLVDRKGIVRLYNPGQMSEQALDPLVKRLLGES